MVWVKNLDKYRLSLETFIKKNIYLLFAFLLLLVFFVSTRLYLYSFILWKIFDGKFLEAYLTDQLLFTYIFFLFFTLGIFLYKLSLKKTDFIVFLGLILYLLIFNSETLSLYFRNDDYLILLGNLIHPVNVHEAYSGRRDFFYYQFMPFSFLFFLFKYNSFFYNLASLVMMALSATVLFRLLHYLNVKLNLGNIILVFLLTLLFLINPIYMDLHVYLQNFTATGYILVFLLLSVYFYLIFFEIKDNFYFLLSYICLLILLKTAFVRAGYFPAVLIFLEILHFSKNRILFIKSFIRIGLIIGAFLLISKAYYAHSADVRLYGISFISFANVDRLYLAFSNQIPVFIPIQILKPIYDQIAGNLEKIIAREGYLFNNLFFLTALFLDFLVLVTVIFLSRFNSYRENSTRILFFFVAGFFSLTFFMLFGNVDKAAMHHSFDIPLTVYGAAPGSRYYIYPFSFFLISFYIGISTLLQLMNRRFKLFSYTLISVLLIFLIISNIRTTNQILHKLNEGNSALKYLTERVKVLIPDNKEEKVFYSTNGQINLLNFVAFNGFLTVYKYKWPEYIHSENHLIEYLTKVKIKGENFYAIYFNEHTKEFIDQSSEYRLKYKAYFINE